MKALCWIACTMKILRDRTKQFIHWCSKMYSFVLQIHWNREIQKLLAYSSAFSSFFSSSHSWWKLGRSKPTGQEWKEESSGHSTCCPRCVWEDARRLLQINAALVETLNFLFPRSTKTLELHSDYSVLVHCVNSADQINWVQPLVDRAKELKNKFSGLPLQLEFQQARRLVSQITTVKRFT